MKVTFGKALKIITLKTIAALAAILLILPGSVGFLLFYMLMWARDTLNRENW